MSTREAVDDSNPTQGVPPFLGILLMALITILLGALLGASVLV